MALHVLYVAVGHHRGAKPAAHLPRVMSEIRAPPRPTMRKVVVWAREIIKNEGPWNERKGQEISRSRSISEQETKTTMLCT